MIDLASDLFGILELIFDYIERLAESRELPMNEKYNQSILKAAAVFELLAGNGAPMSLG